MLTAVLPSDVTCYAGDNGIASRACCITREMWGVCGCCDERRVYADYSFNYFPSNLMQRPHSPWSRGDPCGDHGEWGRCIT